MRNMLRSLVLAPALLASAVLATQTASAETLNVKVPFNFTVSGKACPAGTYSLKKIPNHNLLTMTSKDTSRSFVWILNPGGDAQADKPVSLKFDEQGDIHVLKSVQYNGMTTVNLSKGHDLEHRTMPGQGR